MLYFLAVGGFSSFGGHDFGGGGKTKIYVTVNLPHFIGTAHQGCWYFRGGKFTRENPSTDFYNFFLLSSQKPYLYDILYQGIRHQMCVRMILPRDARRCFRHNVRNSYRTGGM